MRKLIFILSCFIFYLNSNGQTTRSPTSGFVPRANQTIVVEDGDISARNGLYVPRYNDTTQANTFILKDTAGNVIYTYATQSLWLRINETASNRKWVAVGAGGGGSGTVTNVATTNGLGISSSVANPTTTPNITIAVDTSNASILSRQRAAATYATIGSVIAPFFPTTGTGTATGNVIGSLAGNVLTVVESGNEFLNITPTAGAEGVILQAYNITDGDNRGGMYGLANNAAASSSIYADFNASADRADIVLSAQSGVTSITHTADNNIINGNVGVGVSPTVLFQVQSGGNDLISIDATAGSEASSFRAYNTTGSGNIAYLDNQTTNTSASFELAASFNAVDVLGINGVAVTGSATMQYLAAQGHTFTGNILTATNNTYDIGDATNSFKDIYARQLILDGSTTGTVQYIPEASSRAPNVITASGTGYGHATMISRLTSDFTQSNVSTEQPVFSTGQDVWTLQGSTTYYFEGFYTFTHGATSHSVSLSFLLGGGASVTSIAYNVIAWIQGYGTTTATQTATSVNVATSVAVNQSGANAAESIRFSGFISMNAGGTVTPSMTYSADPGGTILTKAGSYITFTPIGVNTIQTLGNVN